MRRSGIFLRQRMALMLAMLTTLTALAACVPGNAAAGSVREGDSAPWPGLASGRPTLVWVIDAAACLGCDLNEPARVVRSILRDGPEGLALRVIALSEDVEEYADLVEGFLEFHRIAAPMTVHSHREHLQTVGSGPVPGFYLVDGQGVIRGIADASEAGAWQSTAEALDMVAFLKLLAEEGQGGGIGIDVDSTDRRSR